LEEGRSKKKEAEGRRERAGRAGRGELEERGLKLCKKEERRNG
jgi:hypothetical protein